MKLYYITGLLILLLINKLDNEYKTKYAVALIVLSILTCLLFMIDEFDIINKVWR